LPCDPPTIPPSSPARRQGRGASPGDQPPPPPPAPPQQLLPRANTRRCLAMSHEEGWPDALLTEDAITNVHRRFCTRGRSRPPGRSACRQLPRHWTGCGVVVFGNDPRAQLPPLHNSRFFAVGRPLRGRRSTPPVCGFHAMSNHPFIVGGTDRFDSFGV